MNKKILIMVLSYNHPPFDALMKAQKQTWGLVASQDDDVIVIYYYGGGFGDYRLHGNDLMVKAKDDYYYMAGKFKKALEFVHENLTGYDIMFRTNSSSYVNIDRLKERVKDMPSEGVYEGWEIETNEGFSMVSGAGIFMTPDVAKILEKEIDPEFEKEEDYYIGQILHGHGIKVVDDKSRVDLPQDIVNDPLTAYHVRFKGGHSREADIENMLNFHTYLLSLK